MTSRSIAIIGVKSHVGDRPGERDLLLSAIRAASAKARLIAIELDSIGVSFRQKVICEQALTWAREEDLSRWIKFGPEASGATT
jgi:hypothetical protein